MNYKLKTKGGECIDAVMKKAQSMSKQVGNTVEFDFNSITVLVDDHTNLDHLYRDFNTAFLTGWKTIGPQCMPEYTESILKEIESAEEAQAKRQEEQAAKWKLEEDAQKAAFTEKVGESVLLTTDTKLWMECINNNQDDYGKCCVDYARDWGRLMQYYIHNGETVVQCAERASHELGWYGITGFMYGAAVMMLSSCWKYGEELRKWHNKEYNHEGDGVVNPAILTINPS